jgi:hypothetical protein
VPSGSPATLTAGRSANESWESAGALRAYPGRTGLQKQFSPPWTVDSSLHQRRGLDRIPSAMEHQNVSSYTLVPPRSLLLPKEPQETLYGIPAISPLGSS